MSTSYSELLKQIEALTRQAEELRQAETAAVIADIREKISLYGLTAADLGFREGKQAPRSGGGSRKAVAAKYRNPATGETWSGRGRAPKWLADAEAKGQKRESFAV